MPYKVWKTKRSYGFCSKKDVEEYAKDLFLANNPHIDKKTLEDDAVIDVFETDDGCFVCTLSFEEEVKIKFLEEDECYEEMVYEGERLDHYISIKSSSPYEYPDEDVEVVYDYSITVDENVIIRETKK